MGTYEIVDFGFDTEYGLLKDFLDYLQGNQPMSLVEQFLNDRKQKSKVNEKSSLVESFLNEKKRNDISSLFDSILHEAKQESKTKENDNQVKELQSLYDKFVNTKDVLKNREFSVSTFIEYKQKQQEVFGMLMYYFTKIRINDTNKKAIGKIVFSLLNNESFAENVLNQDKQSYNTTRDTMKNIIDKLKE